MEELPLNLRIKYFRHTQQNLPEGKEGIRIYQEVFEGRSICTRIVIVEKKPTNRQLKNFWMSFWDKNSNPDAEDLDQNFIEGLQID